MRHGLLSRRIPTILALFLLISGLGIALFIGGNTTQFTGQAAPEDEPKNIQISNITDSSFTLSYVTDFEVLGSIQYGTSPDDQPNLEVSSSDATQMHMVTVTNLTPKTTYYFTITSGSIVYSDNGSPFSVTTGSTLGSIPEERTISGKIVNQDGSESADTFIYVTADNGNILSTKTTTDGTFRLNVSTLRTSDLTRYYPFVDDQEMRLSAVNPTHDAKAVFRLSEADPLSPITLSQVYNFTIGENGEQPVSDSGDITFPAFRDGATEEQTVAISNPETNNEGFTDLKPRFEGRGLPNEQVEIIIQSNHEIQTSITTDENGNWTYRPETPLEAGEHTLTVRTRDENGILRILTRSFTVYAQGSQFTEPSVSPSAPTVSPTTTPSPTTSLTPTPSVTDQIPNISPTPTGDILSPTPSATPSATFTPTPIPSEPTITPRPTVEPTGSNSATFALFTSLSVVLAGGFFYLLSRMKIL